MKLDKLLSLPNEIKTLREVLPKSFNKLVNEDKILDLLDILFYNLIRKKIKKK